MRIILFIVALSLFAVGALLAYQSKDVPATTTYGAAVLCSYSFSSQSSRNLRVLE